jgi:Glyoxalase-like domain
MACAFGRLRPGNVDVEVADRGALEALPGWLVTPQFGQSGDPVTLESRWTWGSAAYRNLGFHLTEHGHHTLGSANHLALFETNYLDGR